tara:strand:+ start:3131 stop:4372 length:1242 start_codon:yes stop_codon:yes gene_type:complete
MNNIKFKNYILNFFTLLISIVLCLLIVNVIFVKISNQKYFPRALANSLSNILQTFYPTTYNKNELKDYVAILGDSYSQGAGDAYLRGTEDYALGHHLHAYYNKNYLNFGRGGYGSISAASNLILINKLSNLPNMIEDLEKPKSIIFLFYEGNDLEENIYEYNSLIKSNENISDFVSRRIKENVTLSSSDKLTNVFPLLIFIKKIYEHFFWHMNNLINKIGKAESLNESISLVKDRIKKLFGYTIVLNESKVDESTYINSIKKLNIKNVRPLQSAAVVLTQEEILIALEIFFESIGYIKTWSKVDDVLILYIPSPISSYTWEEPITYEYKNSIDGKIDEIKRTSNKKNNLNSLFIRNKIKNFSAENTFQFLDTTDYLIEKGKVKNLHGPLDWRHFNYDGYKNVSNYIIDSKSNN